MIQFVPLVFALVAQISSPGVQASQKPPCEISSEAGYAYTPEQPVQVGGSPLYGASRQRRYLDSLRGPEGQVVSYKRLGQQRAPDETILDAYAVTYEGLEKPVTLYLDWYHYNPIRAPRGFTCWQPFNIGAPPLDPFRESDQIRELAIAQGAAREFTPIPLSEGSPAQGVIYDQFRVLANAARAAAAKQTPLNGKQLPKELAQTGMLLVAYPLSCDGKTNVARAVTLSDAKGAPVPQGTRLLAADIVSTVLPGVTIPPGAIVAEVRLSRPRPGDQFEITYTEPGCGMPTDRMTFRSTFTAARGVEMPDAVLPEGAEPGPPMLLQVVVDTDGKVQQPFHVGGDPKLLDAAKEAVTRWRVEPARANGAPVATGVVLQVRFAAKK